MKLNKILYPNATYILILCDSGGANGHRLLNGKDRYEVTWVVNGFDYYNRYINKVPE
jgi:hypothetical protein